ncbi:MAG: D-tagatose-bisphosphate aldolase, class II, non-catalytic subunit [Spirochaetaceae bacterium]|nr:D-tagatose-bisphosphate aldolase, class II, non-catalytic subunit [Spirochaetaceae bacterium]
MDARDLFIELLKNNKKGGKTGIYSICSAQKNVLFASMVQAKEDNSIVLIESTSNQVDQNGGYTGMTPQQFVNYVYSIAEEVGLSINNILLGGDHLGPNAWQNLPAEEAMTNAHILINDYVKAGYQKIHLDASMFLADDEGDRSKPLSDEVVASRAAELCATAEKSWKKNRSDYPRPVYIIGTEVPIPGGAQEEEDHVDATTPEDAHKTIAVTKKAFLEAGLDSAWERVLGVVVQPGVEFGDDQVFDYDRKNATDLAKTIEEYENLVFEAHSTDYQSERGLTELVEDHFCILKVGPWLTYAYREALFALAKIENELLSDKLDQQSFLIEKLDEVMVNNRGYWQKYYPGTEKEKEYKRKYSFSDRSRYYWPDENLNQAKAKLFKNLKTGISLSLLSQYMPNQYTSVRDGKINAVPEELVIDRIRDVLKIYARACKLKKNKLSIKGDEQC